MHIRIADKRYVIDRQKVRAFMQGQGFSIEDIAQLIISVQPSHPVHKQWGGKFEAPSTVDLYTQGASEATVNETLVHELRHYWQWRQEILATQQAKQAYQQIQGKKARQAFYQEYLQRKHRWEGETQLPYAGQPCEHDANVFAQHYAPMYRLIIRREIYRVELPPEVVCLCETELRSWLKPLGAWLVREKERVEAVNLSREEAERLLFFLRFAGRTSEGKMAQG